MPDIRTKSGKMRIRHQFGQHIVGSLDDNGVWVIPEYGTTTAFPMRADAEEYIGGWVDADAASHDQSDDVDPDA